MDNEVSEYARPYGMDGSVVAWFKDINGNSAVDTGDTVYIYAGMRRGGRNYYGLDVSDRSSPLCFGQSGAVRMISKNSARAGLIL